MKGFLMLLSFVAVAWRLELTPVRARIADYPSILAADARNTEHTEDENRTIREGDDLRVRLDDLEGPGIETKVTPRVDARGDIILPHIHALKAKGLTLAQLELAIFKAYRDSKRSPLVTAKFAGQAPPTTQK